MDSNKSLNPKKQQSHINSKTSADKSLTFFSIDRFEEDLAICENKISHEIVNIPKNLLPIAVKEGDIIKFENDKYILDIIQTSQEQAKVKKLANQVFKRKNN